MRQLIFHHGACALGKPSYITTVLLYIPAGNERFFVYFWGFFFSIRQDSEERQEMSRKRDWEWESENDCELDSNSGQVVGTQTHTCSGLQKEFYSTVVHFQFEYLRCVPSQLFR